MGFDTNISDRIAKMRAATLLGDIFQLHQRTKTLLKYVQKTSGYGILLQYQLLTHKNIFQEMKDTKAGLIELFSIFEVESRKKR